MTLQYLIRQATPDDADVLVRMHTAAHEECYAHLLPPEFFAGRRASLPERIEGRRPHLDSTDPRLLAFDEAGALVGFADAGPSRDDDRPGVYELYGLYVLARAYGTGLGARLLSLAVRDEPVVDLWAAIGNERALAFYRKHGFVETGATKDLGGEWVPMRALRMTRTR
ncbi:MULTISPECIES: GNAT family N-acetyltransferase [Arthrobacter]|uniref:GNAT family N-acetyltransferase n=2 Tax=Arthrobacter TaxID=1663 RepID=A0ABU9KI81_9MICC|nr:GNAT family N-acetyltransferase [Arthrobacter sp. YJM1]MDP5226380.1 GNAT family N-acetyltransferase [Arthrobacter sp. YJM1]